MPEVQAEACQAVSEMRSYWKDNLLQTLLRETCNGRGISKKLESACDTQIAGNSCSWQVKNKNKAYKKERTLVTSKQNYTHLGI